MEKVAGSLSHLLVTVFLSSFGMVVVIPGITDVTMSALCPGQDECSLAIYLSGFQQAITGVGTVLMMPLIGSLSDVYGRKALLTFPMTLSIIPLAILAYRRTTNYFYAYYVTKTIIAMASEGSLMCLSLAYVADNIAEDRRASAFGIVSGVMCAAFVFATLAARFISTAQTFQVAAIVSMIAVVYMRIFLQETSTRSDSTDSMSQPILISGEENTQSDGESSNKVEVFKKVPSLKDLVCLLKTSPTFSQAAFVAFFYSLAEGGLQSSTLGLYHRHVFCDFVVLLFNYWHIYDAHCFLNGPFSKRPTPPPGHMFSPEYLRLLQLLLMPMLAPVLGEGKLLSMALFVAFLSLLVQSIAWSIWVPYVTAALGIFTIFASPCLRSIVSKQVGPNEQGIVQGSISGISSFANIISPIIFSPLTDLFLSKRAPFYFPGFSIMCSAFSMMIAFIPSVLIRASPPISSNKAGNNDCREA